MRVYAAAEVFAASGDVRANRGRVETDILNAEMFITALAIIGVVIASARGSGL